VSAQLLHGRDSEIALLDEWLRDLGERGGALLVRGNPGIGKTAILDAAAGAARSRGCRVLTVTGVECETHLPFAGLHQLLRPVLARAEGLPPPQRQALLTAFGFLDAGVPVIFLVGLGALNLLADEPVLLVADDVDWLDAPTAEVLTFVGRRLESDPILFLAAMRDAFQSPLTAARLPELVLEPLGEAPSADLLAAQPRQRPQGGRAHVRGVRLRVRQHAVRGRVAGRLRAVRRARARARPVPGCPRELQPARPDAHRLRQPRPRSLLIIAGGADHIVPAAVDASAARCYAKSPAVTAYRSFPGCSHYTIEPGWEEVADYALSWTVENATVRTTA
jgi:AAA ATPase domain